MKNPKPILICLLFPVLCAAQQQVGPSSASSFSNGSLGGSSATWVNTNLAGASDNNYSTFGNIPGPAGNYTDYLQLTNFNLTVPIGTVILGIIVDIERSDPNGVTSDNSIRLIKGGVLTEDRSTGQAYPLTDGIQTFGGMEDQWGETWSYKDFTDPGFAVAISAKRNSNSGITAGRIDNVTVTVYFKYITLPLRLQEFSVKKEKRTALISWKAAEETDISDYCIERSADGEHFVILGTVNSLNRPMADYSFMDKSPLAGNSFYRLHIREHSGGSKYSSVQKINFDKNELFELFPSPWNSTTDLFIVNPIREELKVKFYSASGQKITEMTTATEKLQVPAQLKNKGLFYYRIFNSADQLKGSGSLVIN